MHAGTGSRRSRRRCARSTTWCAPGKVRYIGFSDTPAWKVAQAQTIARFRGWAPLIALQIEYSLLERTVEGELIPMARELGLGVTPWSPLQGGVLTGKYTRDERGDGKADRGERVHAVPRRARPTPSSTSSIAIAKELQATPARVALAWVQGRPRRRVDDHRRAHAGAARPQPRRARRGAERRADRARSTSCPSRRSSFPMQFLNVAGMFSHGGTTVNGEKSPPSGRWRRRTTASAISRSAFAGRRARPCRARHVRSSRCASTVNLRAMTPIWNALAGR